MGVWIGFQFAVKRCIMGRLIRLHWILDLKISPRCREENRSLGIPPCLVVN